MGFKYSYNFLKSYADYGNRLGMWNGYPIFSCSKENLRDKAERIYYVLYDDDNLIVDRKYDRFYIQGQLEIDGTIENFKEEKLYLDLREPVERSVEPKPATSSALGNNDNDNDETNIPDIRLNNMVENTLKTAREITIDDLLKGFDYGLA